MTTPANAAIQPLTSSYKTYRRPRRRPAHLRTKTGCLTCRRRKKKCDETRLACLNCAKRGLICEWPPSVTETGGWAGNSPPLNRQRSNILDNGTATTVVKYDHQRPWRTYCSDEVSDDSSEVGSSTGSSIVGEGPRRQSASSYMTVLSGLHRLSTNPSSAVIQESGRLFDFLRVTFLPQLIRPTANGRIIDFFTQETLTLAIHWPFCMHALLACCGSEIPTGNGEFRLLARFHYVRAVEGLRANLDNGRLNQQWIVTILTVLMLCIYERSKPQGSTAVDIHLVGAARLIRLDSQRSPSECPKSEVDKAMHRLVRESFIFHVATSLPFQQMASPNAEIDSAFSLAEDTLGQHFHIHSPSHPDSPVLGVPPQLFRCIYTIYRLYQECSRRGVDIDHCRRLEQELIWWDHLMMDRPTSGRDQSGDDNCVAKGALDHPNAYSSSPPFIGPRLYVLGARILLQRMVIPGLTGSDPVIDQLVTEAMSVVQQLEPARDYFAEYYCWPFLVLGLILEHPPDQGFLMSQILAFWSATNNGTMRRLADMLRLYWQSRPPRQMPIEMFK
ncbi:C6 zinc finger domain protein [Penicillium riverlandense]|uniref:C6 zinc finger domain protein n=1 Tax=Penicillium riverlandense TaxID=1903569 RepID=UPI00254664C4|nr:C6 zinc finger domain protein [Penicillium riverlandense]KAJ5831719.1 C6 zinc finger domain protein [Penicillium riverlandense]